MTLDSRPDSEPVLVELRKLHRTIWLVLIFLIFCAVSFVLAVYFTPVKPRSPLQNDSWLEVQAAIDRLDYDRASAIAKRIVTRFPKDHYGYAELGHISLILGDVKAAESYYSQAYELFPGDSYTKNLTAIRQRIQKEAGLPRVSATP